MKTLKDLFLNELTGIYDAERQTVKALPKLIKAATCTNLKAALQAHLTQTEGHVTKLGQVLQSFDQKPKGKTCPVTAELLAHGDAIAADYQGSPALNAGLISAAQKVEHHEIAAYGALHAWAVQLGNPQAATLLEEILREEKAANDTLTKLALATSNQEALGEGKPPGAETPAVTGADTGAVSRSGVRTANLGRKPATAPTNVPA